MITPRANSSCLLFHGPGSEARAFSEAKGFGKLVPFDSTDLKKEGARGLVVLLSTPPIGGGTHSVVVGPLDEASPSTSDVLLKTLEEFDPKGIRPFLWAWDLGGVSKTVRSRCICFFAGGEDERLVEYRTQANEMLKQFLGKDWVGLIEAWKESKGDEGLVLRALAEVLVGTLAGEVVDPRVDRLWENLRPLFGPAPLTPARVLAAFLEAGL